MLEQAQCLEFLELQLQVEEVPHTVSALARMMANSSEVDGITFETTLGSSTVGLASVDGDYRFVPNESPLEPHDYASCGRVF